MLLNYGAAHYTHQRTLARTKGAESVTLERFARRKCMTSIPQCINSQIVSFSMLSKLFAFTHYIYYVSINNLQAIRHIWEHVKEVNCRTSHTFCRANNGNVLLLSLLTTDSSSSSLSPYFNCYNFIFICFLDLTEQVDRQ